MSHDDGAVAISVVVAVHNGAAHVEGLRAMLEAQDVSSGVEVVLVDDASRDATLHLLNTWAGGPVHGGGRVRVVALPHQSGAAAARRAGLGVARGRWVWFADADDRFEPWLLRRALELAEGHQADIVSFRAHPEHEDGTAHPLALYGAPAPTSPRVLQGRDAVDAVFSGSVMGYLWDKLFSRELVTRAFDESVDLRTHEDLLLLLRVLQQHPRVVVSADAPYAYVVRSSSLSNARRASYRDLLRCAQEAERLAATEGGGPHHGTFLVRYVGLSALEDAMRKGDADDLREAVVLCRDHLRRAGPRQVARDHGWRFAARALAARCAPRTYAATYQFVRSGVRRAKGIS